MLPLIGIILVVVGFALRLNPLLVVTGAGLATGIAAGLDFRSVVATFGHAFIENRYVAIAWLILPVIGLLERAGLRERARDAMARIRTATTGRLLIVYFVVRQATAALGLTSLGGHAQMVRPLVAPMAEALAEQRVGPLTRGLQHFIRAHTAATDNIALFFGEDLFIAIGSILLMKGFLAQNGIVIEPMHFALWAIPTAVLALIVHGARLLLLDRKLAALAKHRALSDGQP